MIDLDVHVVSDLRVPIRDGAITATLSWPGLGTAPGSAPGSDNCRVWRFGGGVDADACARVGTVQMVTPETGGPLILDLDLTWSEGKAHNRYLSQIAENVPRHRHS
jgi:hypothetical protein